MNEYLGVTNVLSTLMQVCVYLCIYMHIHVYTCICIRIFIHIYNMYIYESMYICVRMYDVRVCACVSACVSARARAYHIICVSTLWQKRPTYMAKATYLYGKRDLLYAREPQP